MRSKYTPTIFPCGLIPLGTPLQLQVSGSNARTIGSVKVPSLSSQFDKKLLNDANGPCCTLAQAWSLNLAGARAAPCGEPVRPAGLKLRERP